MPVDALLTTSDSGFLVFTQPGPNSDGQHKQKRLPKEPLLITFCTVMLSFV